MQLGFWDPRRDGTISFDFDSACSGDCDPPPTEYLAFLWPDEGEEFQLAVEFPMTVTSHFEVELFDSELNLRGAIMPIVDQGPEQRRQPRGAGDDDGLEDPRFEFSSEVMDVGDLEPGTYLLRVRGLEPGAVYRMTNLHEPPALPPGPVIVSTGGPYHVLEGDDLPLGVDVANVESGTSTIEWDLNGDGDYGDAQGASPVVTWDELEALDPPVSDGPSTFEVGVRVTAEGHEATASASLEVVNKAPEPFLIDPPSEGEAREELAFRIEAIDSSFVDRQVPHAYLVSWGDGTDSAGEGFVELEPVTLAHRYDAAGEYTLRVDVTDKDGGVGSIEHTVTITGGLPRFRRGDVDADGVVGLTDAINNLSFQFLGSDIYSPPCLDACDFDDSGEINISDPIASLQFQFLGGPPPPAPGGSSCGEDPTDDTIDCATPPGASCEAGG